MSNFYIYQSDITVDLQTNAVKLHRKQTEDWKVSIIDTGLSQPETKNHYGGTYVSPLESPDSQSRAGAAKMAEEHKRHKKAATFAAAHPTGRNEILPMTQTFHGACP